jgi:hypothetical protein
LNRSATDSVVDSSFTSIVADANLEGVEREIVSVEQQTTEEQTHSQD